MSTTTRDVDHPTREQLDVGLDEIRRSPSSGGPLLMIVKRPDTDQREVVEEAELDLEVGIVGDNWRDRTDNLETQITIINSRALNLMAGSKDRWQVAGDQLIVDMDISIQNLPPGSRVAIGTTVIEFSEKPHTGCEKFSARFGLDSLQFVSTPTGRDLRLRGVNCRLIQPGTIRVGDTVTKVTN